MSHDFRPLALAAKPSDVGRVVIDTEELAETARHMQVTSSTAALSLEFDVNGLDGPTSAVFAIIMFDQVNEARCRRFRCESK